MNYFSKHQSKFIVGAVILFPILFYVILNIGKHNYTRLSYYTKLQHKTNIENAPKIDEGFFLNQNNDTVLAKDNTAKITIWNVLNTNDYLLSPSVIANLQFLQDRFKDRSELQFNSLVSNKTDTLQLKKFIKTLNINTYNWQILHADSVLINSFAKDKLFLTYKKLPDSLNQVVPTVQVVLVDQNLYIRGYFDGATHKEVKGELLDAIDMLIREQFVVYKNKSKSRGK